MRKAKGKFIVLEGIDGSGKTVQFKRLLQRLKRNKKEVKSLDFPRYGKPSSYFVEQYLRGRYGDWQEVSAYRASLFYALDRFSVSRDLKKWLAAGKIVISNRYVGSNLGHQGVKIKNKNARKKFYQWVYSLEYNILGLPKPNLSIFLHMPAKIALNLINRKRDREYLGCKKKDIHEKDISHIKQAEKIFCEVVNLYPKDFTIVECARSKSVLSKEEIEDKIWQKVKNFFKK